MIVIKDLSFIHKKKVIVKDINLTFDEGKVHAIIGKNGSGKTTIMNMIVDKIPVEKNKVLIDGYDSSTIEAKTLLGFMPTQVFNRPRIKAKNLLIDLALFDSKDKQEAENKVDKIVKTLDAQKLVEKSFDNLSSGEIKRFLLINSLIGKPKYLLMDEPIANVDLDSKIKFMKIIEKLKKQGTAIIIVTHNISDFEKYLDTVTIIEDGKVKVSDEVKNILKKNKNILSLYTGGEHA